MKDWQKETRTGWQTVTHFETQKETLTDWRLDWRKEKRMEKPTGFWTEKRWVKEKRLGTLTEILTG